MNSPAPLFNSAIFNNSAFVFSNYLTQTQADDLYISSILLPSSYGTAYAGKIMITDSSNSIQTINQIGFTSMNYNGTVITSTGTEINYLSGITPGTISASKAVIVDANRDITNFRNISLSGTLIASNDISSPIINSNQYLLSGSSILTSALTGIVTGTASASKALVLDSSSNIVGINSLSATDLNISGTLSLTSLTSILTAQITDSNTGSVAFPLATTHLLSSGSPTNNSFGVGMLFNGPNSINSTISYGRIYSTCQLNTSGIHQGSLTFSSVIAGNFVDVMTISSLTSATNNLVAINGATSVLSVYNITATQLTGTLQTTAQTNITSVGTLTGLRVNGNVGISTAAGCKLDIMDGTFRVLSGTVNTPSSGTGFEINYSSSGDIANIYSYDRTGSIYKPINFNDKMRILANGRVGIGTTSPGFSLEVNGQAQMTNISLTSTTDSTSVSTGSFTTLGGISAAKTIYCKQLVADAFGSHLTLKNGANAYVSQSSQSDGILTFTCTYNASNYAQYQFVSCSPGTSGSGANYKGQISVGGIVRANDGHRLDFGSTAQDNIICLFQQNNVSATYMIGANNSAVNITSAGSNGVKLTYSSATGLGAPATIGTTIFHAKGNGNCITTSNLISNTGLHSYGIDSTDLSSYSAGAHIHYAASKASFFGYDYSGGGYRDLSLNNDNLFIKASNGYVGIQQTSPVCPLHVSTTANQTTAATFGFLSNSGSGVATGFTNRAFSIRSDGGIYVVTGEIDCTSDEYFKENINEIDDKKALDFITKIKPISFSYKNADKNLHYGYSAQELVKNKFNYIVGSTKTDEALDERELINNEGEKIIIPKDTKLVVNLLATIPLLHKALQLANERIKRNEEAIAELRELIKPAQEPAKLKRVVKKPIVYKQ